MRKVARQIPVAGPSITAREVRYVADAAAHGWYAQAGDYIRRFEEAFAAHCHRRYAMALPSCTSALHLALVAHGIGTGDEVIVPETTWIASAAPISYVGATPVFVDICPTSWCLDEAAVQAAITPRTRAIIAVNLYGHMPNYTALEKLARTHKLLLIEDAAESIGSLFKGRPAGNFGHVSCFSFHGSKTLTTGEGGMLLTDDAALFARAQQLRDHGRAPGDVSFRNEEVAFKYKMSALQAALGLAQTERLATLVKKKQQIFRWYEARLSTLPGVTLNPAQRGVENSYWMSTMLWDERYRLDKHTLMKKLAAQGIASRPFFDPLSSLPAYAHLNLRHAAKRSPHAYAIAPRALNLPSALCPTQRDVAFVCRTIQGILAQAQTGG